MNLEQKYCRAPLAKAFNDHPFTTWISNQNFTYVSSGSKVKSPVAYESGRPDAFVLSHGQFICIECKYARDGKLFLGDREDKSNKAGWSLAQREWWRYNCKLTNSPYFIAVAFGVGKEHALFLVPALEYIRTEDELGSKHVYLNSLVTDNPVPIRLTAEVLWEDWGVKSSREGYIIPSWVFSSPSVHMSTS